MVDYSIQNKKAWEYNAYEFWVKQAGTPADRAKKDLENPIVTLPEIVKEQKVTYYTSLRESGYSLGFLGVAAAVGLWVAMDYEIPKQKKRRQEGLVGEYSGIVSKKTLRRGRGRSSFSDEDFELH